MKSIIIPKKLRKRHGKGVKARPPMNLGSMILICLAVSALVSNLFIPLQRSNDEILGPPNEMPQDTENNSGSPSDLDVSFKNNQPTKTRANNPYITSTIHPINVAQNENSKIIS